MTAPSHQKKREAYLAYEVKYHKVVIKFLQKQNKDFVKRALDAFDEIALNPTESNQDIKPLSGSPKNHYRLRIGKFRFLYEVMDDKLLIYCYDADSRGGIYK
jgi:mRNA interferase RelE/StbE